MEKIEDIKGDITISRQISSVSIIANCYYCNNKMNHIVINGISGIIKIAPFCSEICGNKYNINENVLIEKTLHLNYFTESL